MSSDWHMLGAHKTQMNPIPKWYIDLVHARNLFLPSYSTHLDLKTPLFKINVMDPDAESVNFHLEDSGIKPRPYQQTQSCTSYFFFHLITGATAGERVIFSVNGRERLKPRWVKPLREGEQSWDIQSSSISQLNSDTIGKHVWSPNILSYVPKPTVFASE